MRSLITTVKPEISFINNGENGEASFQKELDFSSFLGGSYHWDKNTVGLDGELSFSNYESGAQVDRSWVSLTPYFKTRIDFLDLEAGVQANIYRTAANTTETQFAPIVKLGAPIFNNWRVEAGYSNVLVKNTLQDLLGVNYFLQDSLDLQTTIEKVPFWLNVSGTPFSNLELTAGVKVKNVENALYTIPLDSDSSRFGLRYDQDQLNVLEFAVGLKYRLGPDFETTLDFLVRDNNPGSEIEAWYRATTELRLGISKTWNKLTVSTQLAWISGLRGPNPMIPSESIRLDDILDWSIEATYRFNEKWTGFLQIHNILNSDNAAFLNYPTRGISFKAGVVYNF